MDFTSIGSFARLAAFFVAVSPAVFGQGLQYGSYERDGIAREDQRYSQVMMRISQKRIDVNAQWTIERRACANQMRSSQTAYRQCTQAADQARQQKMMAINNEATRENATHAKNRLEIQSYWRQQMYQPCNRPDCVNNVRGARPVCSGGYCSQ